MMFQVKWKQLQGTGDGIQVSDEPLTSFVDFGPDGTWISITKMWEDYMVKEGIAIEDL